MNKDPSKPQSDRICDEIKARVQNLGFCLCGITTTERPDGYDRYVNWLNRSFFGSMEYLDSERHRFLRRDPNLLAPWVNSIIVLAWPYELNRTSALDTDGQIAGYANKEDYHLRLPRQIQPLLDDLALLFGMPVQFKVFTDNAPILEREFAVRAGLGWIGRNSCVINPDYGSAFLLAEIFIDQTLPPDKPFSSDRCGNCRRCIVACPTGCIQPDRTIDARRCISAMTIEEKGLLSYAAQTELGNKVFGCDICQAVCPWNRIETGTPHESLSLSETEMISILSLDESSFRNRFKETVFLRGKRHGLLRNVISVLGNTCSAAATERLILLMENDRDPVICITAARALMQIAPIEANAKIGMLLKTLSDPLMQRELSELINN